MKPLYTSQSITQDTSIIPLINIVFLMLVFFLIVGHIAKSGNIPIELPESLSNADQPDYEVRLSITHDELIYVNGEVVDLNGVEDKLSELFSNEMNETQEPKILVKADADLLVSRLQAVLKAVSNAGVTNISIATQLSTETT